MCQGTSEPSETEKQEQVGKATNHQQTWHQSDSNSESLHAENLTRHGHINTSSKIPPDKSGSSTVSITGVVDFGSSFVIIVVKHDPSCTWHA